METTPLRRSEGRVCFLETFLRGMETEPRQPGDLHGVRLETFLRGMETRPKARTPSTASSP